MWIGGVGAVLVCSAWVTAVAGGLHFMSKVQRGQDLEQSALCASLRPFFRQAYDPVEFLNVRTEALDAAIEKTSKSADLQNLAHKYKEDEIARSVQATRDEDEKQFKGIVHRALILSVRREIRESYALFPRKDDAVGESVGYEFAENLGYAICMRE